MTEHSKHFCSICWSNFLAHVCHPNVLTASIKSFVHSATWLVHLKIESNSSFWGKMSFKHDFLDLLPLEDYIRLHIMSLVRNIPIKGWSSTVCAGLYERERLREYLSERHRDCQWYINRECENYTRREKNFLFIG